jgi:hypothetical protein
MNMSTDILLPVNDEFVESIAKAIGRDRLYREALDILNLAGVNMVEELDARFDNEFEYMWNLEDEDCVWTRAGCIADAKVAISKINLLLLTMPA